MRCAPFGLAVLASILSLAPRADAQVALPITEVGEGASLRVDGSLREWRDVRFLDVGEGSDASMRVALAYDGGGLYVGAEVRDERLIRTASPGTDEDAVVVTLAMPRGRGFDGVEIWLWAGETGRSAARVGVGGLGRPGNARGAQIVEGPSRGGYVVEAFIPWNAIPGSARWQEGRGSVRLRDVDSAARPEVESEPTFAAVDRAHLELLPTLAPSGGQTAAFESFLASRQLEGARPAHDLRGDVGGDAQPERVSIVDRFLVVTGPGWQEGRGFSFVQLPIAAAADVREPRLVDLTGDGKSELVVTLRQSDDRGSRDLWQVFSFATAQIVPAFAIETRKATGAGSVESAVQVRAGRRGQPATIEARSGRAQGLDASTLQEAPAADAEPILVPWGPVLSREYRWDGSRFARVSERPNPRYVDPATTARASTTATTTTSAAPATPPPPGVEDLLAAFRRERGLRDARPTFRVRANVAADAQEEEVVVYGRDLVVVGPGFRSGSGWFHFQIPAQAAGDVLDVRTAEITGDPRHEILMRVRQNIGDVRREVLLVFQFTPVGFPAILQREVAREQSGRRVENEVRAGNGTLEIRPGTARGWDASSWPWGDTPSTDGIAPPLLPWRDRAVTYGYSGGRLVAR
ncbi:hypothetical protein [Sandaracinus amylolyticus]|nr:hypothetical protein [Sandaracinus amylolyticus]